MKDYKIIWKTTKHAKSYIVANNKKEARAKALEDNLDYSFEELDEDWFWKIEEIIEIEE